MQDTATPGRTPDFLSWHPEMMSLRFVSPILERRSIGLFSWRQPGPRNSRILDWLNVLRQLWWAVQQHLISVPNGFIPQPIWWKICATLVTCINFWPLNNTSVRRTRVFFVTHTYTDRLFSRVLNQRKYLVWSKIYLNFNPCCARNVPSCWKTSSRLLRTLKGFAMPLRKVAWATRWKTMWIIDCS